MTHRQRYPEIWFPAYALAIGRFGVTADAFDVADRSCEAYAAELDRRAGASSPEPTDDTATQLHAVAAKLKRIEPCAAASIEGRPCVTADVHWCGREIERIARRVEAWAATSAREAERDARRIVRAETAAKDLADAVAAALRGRS